MEKPGVFLPQGNAVAEKPEFDRIAADGGACMFDHGALDQAQDHEALHLRIRRVDGPDDAFLAAFQRCESMSVICHKATI